MQKVIVVEGPKGSGKTSSIHEAASLLGVGITLNSPADIFMVVHLKFGRKIYKVGIASAGDSADIIKSNIDLLYHHHLDYVITACSAPVAGMPVLAGFAALERATLVRIPIVRTPSPTPAQIAAKITAIAQQIRNELP